MNAETGSLVLEHLRATRADTGAVRDDVQDLRQRVSSVERHLANIQSDRLERIERRLELA